MLYDFKIMISDQISKSLVVHEASLIRKKQSILLGPFTFTVKIKFIGLFRTKLTFLLIVALISLIVPLRASCKKQENQECVKSMSKVVGKSNEKWQLVKALVCWGRKTSSVAVFDSNPGGLCALIKAPRPHKIELRSGLFHCHVVS